MVLKAALLWPLSLQDLTHSCHSPIDLLSAISYSSVMQNQSMAKLNDLASV